MPNGGLLFESCVDSLESAIASARGGAARVELCANLDLGGTTPDVELIRRSVDAIAIPVFVMIRPRGGDFCYDARERRVMVQEIERASNAGAHGIVTGALQADKTIDVETMQCLIEAARPLPVTFHRAVDATRDIDEALDTVVGLGVARVLTSGGAATAAEGAAAIADLAARAGDVLTVIAAGGVRAHNVAALVQLTRVREVHARLINNPPVTLVDDAQMHRWQLTIAEFVTALGG
jgi:copper homeostasis protein